MPLEDGFVLTSNRDENPKRKTSYPENVEVSNDISLMAPIDKEKGGTWIAADKKSLRLACLLNGGKTRHTHNPPYRKSRGHIVLEAFMPDNFSQFATNIFLEGIEPFTLLLADSNKLIELIWNGKNKEINKKNMKSVHIWSSSTLYTPEQAQQKRIFFENYLTGIKPSSKALLNLHGVYGSKEFLLDRENVKTVSTTQVVLNTTGIKMHYHDYKLATQLKSTRL